MSREKLVEMREAMGLHVRTTALDVLGGRVSWVGETEAETVGGRVIMGPTRILTGFNTYKG